MLRFLLLILLAAPLAAAEPKGIIFPDPPPTPKPAPTDPSNEYSLAADELLVFQSDAEVFTRQFPAGGLNVTVEKGPLTIRSRFYGGGGKMERKTFPGPFVYLVEPAKNDASTELLVIPSGLKADGEIRQVTVKSGKAPQPPPPGPDPKPEPNPSPTAKAVYMAVIRDSAAITPKLAGLLGDTPFWNSFKTAGHEWDFYDDTPTDDAGRDTEAKKKGYLRLADRVQTSGQPFIPTLILLNKDTGDILKVIPLPADKTGVQTAVKEVAK